MWVSSHSPFVSQESMVKTSLNPTYLLVAFPCFCAHVIQNQSTHLSFLPFVTFCILNDFISITSLKTSCQVMNDPHCHIHGQFSAKQQTFGGLITTYSFFFSPLLGVFVYSMLVTLTGASCFLPCLNVKAPQNCQSLYISVI